MASPLDILGGLGQIGSQGFTGAYQGEIEGIKLRKDFESREIENQLRQMELAVRQQQAQQRTQTPIGFGPGTMMFDPSGRPMGQVPFAPRPPVSMGPGHSLVDPTTGRSIASTPPAPVKAPQLPAQVEQAWGAYKGQNPEASFWDFYKQYAGLSHPGPQPHQSAPFIKLERDAQGNVKQIITTLDAQGNYKTRVVPLGPIGMPQRPVGGAGATPRETTEESWKITPRKLLSDQETKSLNRDLPKLVDELSQKPGFNVPGAYVTLPNGLKVRKEEVLSRYVLQRSGIEVKLVWDPDERRFIVTKAWNPATRELQEKTRRTGPPGTTNPSQEEASDEEE